MSTSTNRIFSGIAICGSLFLASCSGGQQSSGKSGISGKIENGAGQTVYLERYVNQRTVVTDSAMIDGSGNFSIQPTPPLELNYFRLSLSPDNALMILTDSTESLYLEADAGDLDATAQIDGSKNSALLLKLDRELSVHRDAVAAKREALKTGGSHEEIAQLKSDVNQEMQAIKRKSIDFIKANEGSPATLAALADLSLRTDLGFYEKVLETTKNDFGHSYYYRIVSQQIGKEKQRQSLAKTQSNSKNSKYVTGMEAPNIALNNPEGEKMELKDLRGKVVLIDFWASWCGPCRRENPHVVHTYDKYKADGFEVFSVSLDRSIDKWERAIEQDGLKWPYHVSDLKGWQSDAAALFGIHSIPHTILIDQEGTIVGTHLRGPMLSAKLEEIFGH